MGISEWYRSDEGRIHYLEIGGATPPGNDPATWTNTGEFAGGYQPVNRTCPTDTAPLYSWQLAPSGKKGDIYHHAFTTNASWGGTGGWQSLGTAACVFSSPPSGPGNPAVTSVCSVTIDNLRPVPRRATAPGGRQHLTRPLR